MVHQDFIMLSQRGGGACEITKHVARLVSESGIRTGVCQLFVHSSVASIFIADIADESTRHDTASYLADLAPSSDDACLRLDRGMASFDENMRQVVVQNSISFPVSNYRPSIGVWQGIYLWDHNASIKERKLTVTVIGE